MNGERGGSRSAFPGLPGEVVLEEAAGVRLRCRDGDGSVPGTLVCTNLRVAFLAAPGHGVQPPSSVAPLQSEHNVALPCIRKLVAGSSFAKAKVLTAASTLKFIPEELLIFCRDFRLLRFHFHENGLAPQAYRLANAIAKARETATWPWGSRDGSSWAETKPEEEEEDEEEEEEEGDDEEGSAPTLLFESLPDWEKELKRQGAVGWRVSAINERFDMAPSLPRYLWVPSGLLDHDLKRTFAHFEERRVPRLCWHHPGGSDLLRSAGFHAASEPGSEDVRCLEALLRAGRGPCVLADTAELPTLADIQLAHLKLWALCLHGAAPEEKWLSALEATRWLDHVRACLRKAVEVASLLAGRRCCVLLQEPSDRDLNCLLASLVQLLADPHARTLPGFQSLVQREWVAAGHPFPRRLGLRRGNPREEAPVFPLFLDCTWQLVRQFPAAFGFTEAFLLALHDGAFQPYCGTFLFTCQRQRGRGGPQQPRGQTYTPVNGCWDPPSGSRLPPVWDWALRYSPQQRARFRNPAGGGSTLSPPDTENPQTTATVTPRFLARRGGRGGVGVGQGLAVPPAPPVAQRPPPPPVAALGPLPGEPQRAGGGLWGQPHPRAPPGAAPALRCGTLGAALASLLPAGPAREPARPLRPLPGRAGGGADAAPGPPQRLASPGTPHQGRRQPPGTVAISHDSGWTEPAPHGGVTPRLPYGYFLGGTAPKAPRGLSTAASLLPDGAPGAFWGCWQRFGAILQRFGASACFLGPSQAFWGQRLLFGADAGFLGPVPATPLPGCSGRG